MQVRLYLGGRSRRSCIFRSSGLRRMIVLRACRREFQCAAEEYPAFRQVVLYAVLHTDGASVFNAPKWCILMSLLVCACYRRAAAGEFFCFGTLSARIRPTNFSF